MKGAGIAGLATMALLALSGPAKAQVSAGGYFVRTSDPYGESDGVGLRLEAGAPLLPVSLALNGEYFFPDCGGSDCSLRGLTIDANYSLVVPLVQPFVGVGWSVRQSKVDGETSTKRGLNIGVGVAVTLRRVRPFADVRYRPSKIFSGHPYAVRLGVMIR
ncbi:MAG: hypothetical protein PVH00_02630 [Gemmatimonadota bacterium]|jgi:hypothetical protein